MDLQTLIDLDRMMLSKLNGSSSLFLDQLCVTLTSPFTWIPLYLVLLYLVIRNNESVSRVMLIVCCTIFCILLSDIVVDVIVKPMVGRWRPTHDPLIKDTIDVVNNIRETKYGFFSAHASNTFSIALFFCLLVKNRMFTLIMVSWSLINCYTRVYLGVHYPFDILVGLCWGAIAGSVSYLLFHFFDKHVSSDVHYISTQYTSTGYSLRDIYVVVLVFSLILAYATIRAVVTPL